MKKLNDDSIKLLKDFALHNTKPRILVLDIFLKSNAALNYSTLNKCVGKKIDRGTIYRTLYLFLEKGLLHVVPSADGIIHYVLQLQKIKPDAGKHMHFICDKCKRLICLPDVTIPKIKISKKLKVKNIDVVLNGICDECS